MTAPTPTGPGAIELVVGLGNPGEQYAETRHNAGFRVVDELARRHAGRSWVRFARCEVAAAALGSRLLLAKPLTYMNRSGEAVAWLLQHLELEPQAMLVAVDDVDLPIGSLRLRRYGGPGTHNGLRDICDRVGTTFPRLRLGVGADPTPCDLADFVLSPFEPIEQPLAGRMVLRAADAAEAVIRDGLEAAMSSYNGPTPEG